MGRGSAHEQRTALPVFVSADGEVWRDRAIDYARARGYTEALVRIAERPLVGRYLALTSQTPTGQAVYHDPVAFDSLESAALELQGYLFSQQSLYQLLDLGSARDDSAVVRELSTWAEVIVPDAAVNRERRTRPEQWRAATRSIGKGLGLTEAELESCDGGSAYWADARRAGRTRYAAVFRSWVDRRRPKILLLALSHGGLVGTLAHSLHIDTAFEACYDLTPASGPREITRDIRARVVIEPAAGGPSR